ncbi:MAG: hypothetical protein PWR09_684 [Archaeoglobi archaeon]|nr:hypothetical protein [Archaeoglobi archaeon]
MRWIENLTGKEGKVEPNFREYHILMLLRNLEEGRKLSRKEIGERLSLGEGSVRTMLRKLSENGIVEVTPRGAVLSGKGKNLWESLKKRVRIIGSHSCENLTVGKKNFMILLKSSSNFVRNGIEQRDAAVFAGGKGATTMVVRGGRAEIAGMGYELEDSGLLREIDAEDGDVLIIGAGDDEGEAERAAWAAAFTLIRRWGDEE